MLLCLSLLFFTACAGEEAGPANEAPTEQSEQITAPVEAEEPEKEVKKTDAEEDEGKAEEETNPEEEAEEEPLASLEDEEAVMAFLREDPVFQSMYRDVQGSAFAYDDYKTTRCDFNGDGSKDLIIQVWTQEQTYLPAVFLTVVEGQYVFYPSEFRTSDQDRILCEEGWIIRETPNQNYGLTQFVDHGVGAIPGALVTFGDYDHRWALEEIPEIIRRETAEVVKQDGYHQFTVTYTESFFDEMDKERVISQRVHYFQFDPDSLTFEEEVDILAEGSLYSMLPETFVVGEQDDLQSFEETLEMTGDFYAINENPYMSE